MENIINFDAECSVCRSVEKYEKIEGCLSVCLTCGVVQRIYQVKNKTAENIKENDK